MPASLLVPGLVIRPSAALAGPGQTCTAAGGNMTGCWNCMVNPPGPSFGGTGCNGVTSPPAGFSVGNCVAGYIWQSCVAGFINCGSEVTCVPYALTGRSCATLMTCQ